MLTGRSTGKIILFGEHSVVYGYPAIALPFKNVEIQVALTPASTFWIECDVFVGELEHIPSSLYNVKETILLCFHHIQVPFAPFHVTIQSSIPMNRGMGSSAAVCVALTRAFFSYYQQELHEETLFSIVQQAEKIAHGNPSGIDTLATSGSHPIFYQKGHSPQMFPLRLNATLVVADTGIVGETKRAVQLVAARYKEIHEHLYQLGEITKQARIALEHNHPAHVGSLMNQAHTHLMTLGVSSSELNNLVSTARSCGAIGAKLTGGGLGGCMIALAHTSQQAQDIANQLQQSGATQTWCYQLGDSLL